MDIKYSAAPIYSRGAVLCGQHNMCKGSKTDKSRNHSLFSLTVRENACYTDRQKSFSNRNIILQWLCPLPAWCLGIHFLLLESTPHYCTVSGCRNEQSGDSEAPNMQGQQEWPSCRCCQSRNTIVFLAAWGNREFLPSVPEHFLRAKHSPQKSKILLEFDT